MGISNRYSITFKINNVFEAINEDYLFSELVNPVFTADSDNVKVSIEEKFIDNKTMTTQVSQYELILHRDSKVVVMWEVTNCFVI